MKFKKITLEQRHIFLLIVPVGIEISDEQDDGIDRFALLIVPVGIEIDIKRREAYAALTLLIVPVGIEMKELTIIFSLTCCF